MFILEFIKSQKTHLVYLGIIGGLILVYFSLLSKKPAMVVQTQSKASAENRNIVKTKKQSVDRTIVKKDKDGSITTTTEHIVDNDSVVDKTKKKAEFTSSTTTTYLTRYSLDVQYPVIFGHYQVNPFDAKKVIVTGGYRIFNSPIFLTLGTNVGFDSILVGVRYEF